MDLGETVSMRRPAAAFLALAGLLSAAALTGCSHPAKNQPTSARTWVAQQDNPPPVVDPQLPGEDNQPNNPGGPSAQPPDPSGKPGTAQDPNVVADHLDVPWGLAVLPDGTALVGERPTGRILQVQPKRAPVHTVARIRGLDTRGDGGLLGLAVSPSYDEDGLIFAYVTTKTDARVLRFSIGSTPRPILTGLPRGISAVGGSLAFGPDGDLYVSVGDTGHPQAAASSKSPAGKILRITVFGKPAVHNPDAGSAVYASGFHNVTGMCWDKQGRLYATDSGTTVDELDQVRAGAHYGWPTKAYGDTAPLLQWKPTRIGPGGCAIIGFGLFVGELTGKKLLAIALDTHGRPQGGAQPLLKGDYGRLRTVVAAPDGALWITTSNRDRYGKPDKTDDRVLRIKPPSSSTNSPV
jgi:glucose/arabinose dehydrogenase